MQLFLKSLMHLSEILANVISLLSDENFSFLSAKHFFVGKLHQLVIKKISSHRIMHRFSSQSKWFQRNKTAVSACGLKYFIVLIKRHLSKGGKNGRCFWANSGKTEFSFLFLICFSYRFFSGTFNVRHMSN